jgi:hypothetical protein
MANSAPDGKAGPKVRTVLNIFYALPVILVLAMCGYFVWLRASHQAPPVRHISSKPFASVMLDGLTAGLFAQGDQLLAAGNDLFIEFRDQQKNLVDVGNVKFELQLKMPGAVMRSIGKVNRTATPGQYRTSVEPQMGGDWTCTIGFSGPHGNAETNFWVTVK